MSGNATNRELSVRRSSIFDSFSVSASLPTQRRSNGEQRDTSSPTPPRWNFRSTPDKPLAVEVK
jgi:hypothetical protein